MEILIFLIFLGIVSYFTILYRNRCKPAIRESKDNFITKEMRLAIMKQKINTFTLIEVTMSIAIIAVGMVGVMAIFPIGFNAARDAIGDNYSSDMSDQFLHVIAQQVKYYKDTDGNGVISGDEYGWETWVDSPSAKIPLGSKSDASVITKGACVFGDTSLYDGEPNSPLTGKDILGIYEGGSRGIYYVESTSGDIVDFKGVMAIWCEQIKFLYDSTGDGNGDALMSIPLNKAVQLCLEVSWPVNKPYTKREKRHYVLQIYNPN